MKRLFAILLCLVMLLSLVACSKTPNEPNNETNAQGNNTTNAGNTVTVPTKEERDQIEKYKTAVRALNTYAEEGYVPNYKVGEEYLDTNESLGCYYKDIQDSECIEKWIGTEYASDDAINWNRQEVLSNFVIIEDVLLRINIQGEDKLGNIKTKTYFYTYGMDGNLVEEGVTNNDNVLKIIFRDNFLQIGWAPLSHGDRGYIYQDNRLVKTQCYYKGKISATLTPTYNDGGLKIKDLYQDEFNSYEYTYTYDSEDRLVSVEKSDGRIVFEYDENGYLTKMDDDGYLSLYTYNEDYSVCTEKYGSVQIITYTLDEKGRILTGEALFQGENEGEKIHQEQVYGNYYIYKPALQNDASK